MTPFGSSTLLSGYGNTFTDQKLVPKYIWRNVDKVRHLTLTYGWSADEIASYLGITERTIERYIKLGRR